MTQETNFTCISASIQMIFLSTDSENLPSQKELAVEMLSNENNTVNWDNTWVPFHNRNYTLLMNGSLSNIPDVAVYRLKKYLVNNSKIIVNTWYNEIERQKGEITHARVITGYNETGIFFHDPQIGPNIFLFYNDFITLWKTDIGFWALIIEHKTSINTGFNFGIWLDNNFDIAILLFMGIIVEVHYISRLSNFTNSMALSLFYNRNNINNIILGGYVVVGILLGILGLLSYLLDESLPSEYYTFCLIAYNSVSIAIIMLFYNIFIL